ncbi:MAG: MbtH family NRPS accessory protein [Gammaproteobacteria bacterium]|nr:MbtH family NRPS accessory protein [Gammaproteobacteria bacterium]
MPQQVVAVDEGGAAQRHAEYRVVINHEEQYSIWPTGREIPTGWKATGFVGNMEAALRHIESVWTDMRPLNLRRDKAMQAYRKLERRK